MSYKIDYFGWNNTEGHDKVWGYVTIGEGEGSQIYNFWGRRGKTLTFKKQFSEDDGADRWMKNLWAQHFERKIRVLTESKTAKGYTPIDVDKIETVCEGFFEAFEHQLTLAKLFNKFHGVREEE